ncbi:MAG TPA: sigma-70 family RNA polymerase sigma factor [Gemmataceae bacterium]|nr:sigma-70 family RNA polymerase sigma factor [Gemmataceae bacterium]
MAKRPLANVLRHIRSLALTRDAANTEDARLLERFIRDRDEAAFEALLRRHGPMVLGVCRRLLSNPCDVEDAFQVTFLVLVRKARSMRRRDLLAQWLYGVAYRTALKARSQATRRQVCERSVAVPDEPADSNETLTRDLREVLDLEVSRLPEKYRVPVVLCYLEGRTFEEAAAQLGWPAGTVSGRLARAREMLRKRLTRRGLAFPAGLLTAATAANASAIVPAALVQSTVQAAALVAAGKAAISTSTVALLEGVLQAMFWSKVKNAVAAILVVGVLAIGAGVVSYPTWAARQPEEKKAEEKKAAAPAPEAKAEEHMTKLLKERVEAAQTVVDALEEVVRAGQRTGEVLGPASVQLLTAKRELTDNKADQLAAYQAHFKRMKEIEKTCKEQFDAGRIPSQVLGQAQYYRIEAEIWLERAKKK